MPIEKVAKKGNLVRLSEDEIVTVKNIIKGKHKNVVMVGDQDYSISLLPQNRAQLYQVNTNKGFVAVQPSPIKRKTLELKNKTETNTNTHTSSTQKTTSNIEAIKNSNFISRNEFLELEPEPSFTSFTPLQPVTAIYKGHQLKPAPLRPNSTGSRVLNRIIQMRTRNLTNPTNPTNPNISTYV